MKKIISIAIMALVVFTFIGCTYTAKSDDFSSDGTGGSGGGTWTELTTLNISSQISKYNGRFRNSSTNAVIVVDSYYEKIGMSYDETNANYVKVSATSFISNLGSSQKLYGNGGTQLKITSSGFADLIFVKY